MFLKRLFYASASILMLAAAYHLGASTAGAQAGGTILGFSGAGSHCSGTFYVITPSGDVYGSDLSGGPCGSNQHQPDYIGNFWGGATPTTSTTFGALKAKYR
jgi:hypothetical protein